MKLVEKWAPQYAVTEIMEGYLLASMPKLYDLSPLCLEDRVIEEPKPCAIDFYYPWSSLKKQ